MSTQFIGSSATVAAQHYGLKYFNFRKKEKTKEQRDSQNSKKYRAHSAPDQPTMAEKWVCLERSISLADFISSVSIVTGILELL
jgi:hypothetical protein